MIYQRTIRNPIRATGVGLHSGEKVTVTLRPASPNTGIVFRRVDLPAPVNIRAQADRVGATLLCTELRQDGERVATVEHLMAALASAGVDNLFVDLDAPEVPIMDGSASPFVFLLQSAGVEEQPAARRFIRITRPVEIREGDKWARLEPYDGFKIDFRIDFRHPAIAGSPQHMSIDLSGAAFAREIARARTFGFVEDVEKLRAMGLAQGGGFQNAVVLDAYRVLNSDGLRFSDEFVRHKILDAVGDLYLLGSPIIGAFKAFKSGHDLNNRLLRRLLVEQESWEAVRYERMEEVPSGMLQPVLA